MSEQQRLIEVSYQQLKGLRDVTINFEGNPVTGIFGVNGCGKSTILHSLLCFFKPKTQKAKDYKFSYFFRTSNEIRWEGSEMIVTYSYRDGREERTEHKVYGKKDSRWSPKYSRRPDRDVYYIGINTCVPDIESVPILNPNFDKAKYLNNHEYLQKVMSYILNIQYTAVQEQKYTKSRRAMRLTVGNPNLSYTSFSMGAGEQRLLRILQILENAENYSLIIIDEIDLTLHTAALMRLMKHIVDKAKDKHLQVIFTSHREELINCKDINIRHLLKTEEGMLCLEDTTAECMDRLTGGTSRLLEIFVEDDLSEAIIAKLCEEKKIRKRVSIRKFGAIDNAFIASIGLDIQQKDMTKTLFVLDGDKYRTTEEKHKIMEKKYSGTEKEKESRRNRCLAQIKQYTLPEGKSPDEHLCDILKASSADNEIVNTAKTIHAVEDTHEYINRIVEELGGSRESGIQSIINEVSKNTKEWNNMTQEVQEWLDERKSTLSI